MKDQSGRRGEGGEGGGDKESGRMNGSDGENGEGGAESEQREEGAIGDGLGAVHERSAGPMFFMAWVFWGLAEVLFMRYTRA